MSTQGHVPDKVMEDQRPGISKEIGVPNGKEHAREIMHRRIMPPLKERAAVALSNSWGAAPFLTVAH